LAGRGATKPNSQYRIARYAWNEDYHDLIGPKLKELGCAAGAARWNAAFAMWIPARCLERDFASESGLGWGGKSTMQIHRQLGTWFFLAEIITTLDLAAR
jgi:epoxyqueuosine reductase